MQILKMTDGKLTLAHVTPVIRALFAPFGVQDDGTLNMKDPNPMRLDLIPFLRGLMDTMGVDYPAEVTSTAMLNAIARRLGKPDAVSDDDQEEGEDGDDENYLIEDAFDLAVALDDGHGLIEATTFATEHGYGYHDGPDTTTNFVTRHVNQFDRTINGYEHAAAVHDALQRKDYRGAADTIEVKIDELLMQIRDPKARKKVAAQIKMPQGG
ncbi:hypothetical protein [Paraburkholderia sp. C35]|uniref:hypothetical protein n=1 Tax=Paraburkholderia sp. C35 TaxID=2126993 RepID=UPI000D695853|nr:hypothetical protein [Paraburkholderia sp. C35]